MSQPTTVKHYTRILSLWPKDSLRPNLPFTRTIERRATPYGVKPVSPPVEDAKNSDTSAGKPAPIAKSSPQAELPQINALYSLLENRYSKKYPISPGLLKPTSNPEHYDRLMEEIERAPKKSWLQAKMDEWKMKIRWQ
ncbi:uncharacterized protein N0V89_009700 [Didymosphaeria variabile]|uniref:Uncharacterized protein n=1 Tax=Didymosphaeria variabile TaxID=1932322 RepID=A0A9W9C7J3_9PLEO|nr:uncharacterized protein N0V89_009700 [Didymosphaeria variabile]KAJ4348326.1 hypothetical protein N0V89_009700 [Didymosphaeria variabile]